MKNQMGDMLGRLADTTKTALNGLGSLAGSTQDRELAMYNRLKPIDFKRLEQRHGSDTVAKYIMDMEKRRIKESYYGTQK